MQRSERQLDGPGDCLECLEAQCMARDPKKPRFMAHDEDGLPHRRVIGRATATITKALDTATGRKRAAARTALGQKLTARSVIVKSKKGFTRDTVENISGADKGTVFYTIEHTLATVQYPFEHVQARLLRGIPAGRRSA